MRIEITGRIVDVSEFRKMTTPPIFQEVSGGMVDIPMSGMTIGTVYYTRIRGRERMVPIRRTQ